MNRTLKEALAHAHSRLPGPTARLDAELLLAHVLGKPRSHVLAWPESELPRKAQAQFERLLARRAAGVPMAYLLGVREFWSLRLEVTPDTLVPRPETELLVERALRHLPDDRPVRVLDAGTGTGAVALALAHERPLALVVAVERSPRALGVARRNRDRLGLANVRLVQGHWLQAVAASSLDLIVANPPYVAEHDPHLETGDVAHEPREALASGPDGLDALRELLPQAAERLRPGGWFLFEHGHDQADAAAHMAREVGLEAVHLYRDLAGLPRVTEARRP